MRTIAGALAMLAIALVAGCGGGSSSGSTTDPNAQFHSSLQDAAQAMRAFGADASAGSATRQPAVLSSMKVDAASFATALAALREAGPQASFTSDQRNLVDKMIPLMGDLGNEMNSYIKYAGEGDFVALQPVAAEIKTTNPDLESVISSVFPVETTTPANPVAGSIADPTKCRTETAGLLRALKETNSRLTVGLTFQAYSQQTGNDQVAYDAVAWNTVASDCATGPGALLEKALNSYKRAYSVWNSCVGRYGCDSTKIRPHLQTEWSRASAQISGAEAELP